MTDALDNTTYFGYDPNGNRTSMKDARGNSAQFGFDALNRMESSVDMCGGASYFGYDENGNTTSVQRSFRLFVGKSGLFWRLVHARSSLFYLVLQSVAKIWRTKEDERHGAVPADSWGHDPLGSEGRLVGC
jgi:YD repeat-containing protein